MLNHWIENYIAAQHRALDSVPPAEIAALVAVLQRAHAADRQIFVCGNGGNAANASHFATDLGKNGSEPMPHPFRVASINDNVSWLTAIGNDFAFAEVFVRQLTNYARAGDVLIVSSVSGGSPNLVRALEWARERGMETIALVGGKRGRCAELATHCLAVGDTHYGRVEDVQMHILHMLCYAFAERVAG